MKKPTAKLIPLLATGMMPPAAVTSALLSQPALAGPGDLDPAFGDVGRLGPILEGPAWSLQPLDDGTMLLGGGDMYYWYYYYGIFTNNFISHLSGDGAASPDFVAATLEDIQVFDIARQADGNVVAVGRRVQNTQWPFSSQLVVFRLLPDGPLDTTFGTDGIFLLTGTEHGNRHLGTSVVLDPDGRIVVAGARDDQALVLRLLPDGSFDDSFGTSGVFAGPDAHDFSADASGPRTSILRTVAGGYRVTASNAAGCQVFALAADGTTDAAFGSSGIATLAAPSGPSTSCNAMVAQPDGQLLVAGNASGRGFAARLLADGTPDAGFSTDPVSDSLQDATAVAVDGNGSIIVAGQGVSGTSIMRLLAGGELDAAFGNAGSTLLDLRSETASAPVVRDMAVDADGSVVAVGDTGLFRQGFAVKLLGAAGGASPGVLGARERSTLSADESTGEFVVNVRRTGGAAGAVSLAYRTLATEWQSAVDGEDFTGTSGRLTWADGDMSEQQVRIPILADDLVEDPEHFSLALSDIEGGAGLGAGNVYFEIAADGKPFGQLGFGQTAYDVSENSSIRVSVARNYYASGAVSVTVTPISGTATAGEDFAPDPVTVSWGDGDWEWKDVTIPIVNDSIEEASETFTVELSNPTGGALLGPLSTATVRIHVSDQPPRVSSSGGGGAAGYLSLLALALLGFGRATATRLRRLRASPGR